MVFSILVSTQYMKRLPTLARRIPRGGDTFLANEKNLVALSDCFRIENSMEEFFKIKLMQLHSNNGISDWRTIGEHIKSFVLEAQHLHLEQNRPILSSHVGTSALTAASLRFRFTLIKTLQSVFHQVQQEYKVRSVKDLSDQLSKLNSADQFLVTLQHGLKDESFRNATKEMQQMQSGWLCC